MSFLLISAALFFAANPSPLDQARDRQDPAALAKLLDAAAASAEKAPNDAQAQYQALMDEGIRVGREFQLSVGVALSAEQMARLTTPPPQPQK